MAIPVCKPLLPLAEEILPYLQEIDVNRYYSNMGPLTKRFESKLAKHFGCDEDHIVTSTNGTLALVQTLQALNVPAGSFCVMPSWTFIATASAAVSAGLVPYFVDVDPHDWIIRPHHIAELLKDHTIGAIIPVVPFGHPCALNEWESFNKKTGIPVLVDAAAAFDSFSIANKNYKKTTLPFMVSLHATKVFGIGEGSVTVTSDPELAKRIRMFGNFGFHGSRNALLPGTNAKLSEYAAAIGLAAFDTWAEKRKNWQDLARIFYGHVVKSSFLKKPPGMNEEWASCYGQVLLPENCSIDFVQNQLMENGIHSIRWWGEGCHTHTAYQNYPRTELDVTNHLASRLLGLPFSLGMNEKEFSYIFETLENILTPEAIRSVNG